MTLKWRKHEAKITGKSQWHKQSTETTYKIREKDAKNNAQITEKLHRHENDTTITGKRREKDAKIIGKWRTNQTRHKHGAKRQDKSDKTDKWRKNDAQIQQKSFVVLALALVLCVIVVSCLSLVCQICVGSNVY